MKKIFKSKGFLVTALSVSCIAILAVCWLAGRDKKAVFLPDEQPQDAIQEEWKDTPDTTDPTGGFQDRTDAVIPGQNSAEEKLEGYPKVAEESEQEIVIDFVPEETKDETPPPPPEGKAVTADSGGEHPVNPAPDTAPSSTDTGKGDTPAAGSTNENGAVYDPVFGWVVPGQVNQSAIDSSGDPNKMVGNMGN